MTKHEASASDQSASSRPVKFSKSYASSDGSSPSSTKTSSHAASKRKSEDENGFDAEENGVRLKVYQIFLNFEFKNFELKKTWKIWKFLNF